MIHIKQDGTGDFTSVQAALDSLPANNQEPVTLFIHKGIYRERIHVTVPYVSFVGESAEETILTYGLYARMPSEDIGKLGTFRTYSCFIDTHDFTASNLTFENSAGPGTKAGQALALYVDGDRIAFHNCRFLGNQDTLFTARCRQKRSNPMDSWDRSNLRRGSMDGISTRDATSRAISTLSSAGQRLILKIVNFSPNIPVSPSAAT